MSTEIERIAKEVDACNLPYSMELVRLVDGSLSAPAKREEAP